nr:MAG: putative coat protein [Tombusviridae sp.]
MAKRLHGTVWEVPRRRPQASVVYAQRLGYDGSSHHPDSGWVTDVPLVPWETNQTPRMNSPVGIGIPYMFNFSALTPDEFFRQFQVPKKIPDSVPVGNKGGYMPGNVEVLPSGVVIEHPAEESKELVVFSAKANNQQGLTVVGSDREVSVTQAGIKSACSALAGSFPFPTFGVAEFICQEAANLIVSKGKELTRGLVESVSSTMVKKLKNVGGKTKNEIKNEIKAIVNRASGSAGSSRSVARAGGVKYSMTNAPVAKSLKFSTRSRPRTRNTANGVIITHTEMINTVVSGAPTSNVTAFASIGYRINPGVASIFPWLSSVAVNYEKYRFRSLTFSAIPLVATNYSGRIGVGVDYDSTDTLPANRQEFYALTSQCESMPWDPIMLPVAVDNVYRFTGTHTVADSKLIDVGQVVVMSDSVSNGGTISSAINLFDLVVQYEVELIQPQQALFSTQIFSNSTSLVVGQTLGVGTNVAKIFGPQICNTNPTVGGTADLNITLAYGTYLVVAYVNVPTETPSLDVTVSATASKAVHKFAVSTESLVKAYVNVTGSVATVDITMASSTWTSANLNKLQIEVTRLTPTCFSSVL